MLVISPDATYMLQPDGSTRTVERPDAAKRASRETRRNARAR